VSTKDQHLDLQLSALKRAGCKREKEEVLAAFAAHKNEVTAGYMAAPRQGA
jgi:hypothetical protein